MTGLSIDLPAGLDSAGRERVQRRLLQALGDEISTMDRDSKWDREARTILESDDAFRKWADPRDHRETISFVRASCYADIERYQEVQGFDVSDSRRPVVMKGSLYRLIRLYCRGETACPNGWCYAVFRRWLRRRRRNLTAFALAECDTNRWEAAEHELGRRYGASYHFHNWANRQYKTAGLNHYGTYDIWLRGKFKHGLTRHQYQYIRKMWLLAEKIRLQGQP